MFFAKCPQCGSMIPKDAPVCPNCRHSSQEPETQQQDRALLEEYGRRHSRHVRNYTIFMSLILATGVIGALTAFLWLRVIYRGHIGAFLLIGFMTICTAILGGLLAVSQTLFPHHLNCPSCNTRLDELGLTDGHCPNCNNRLREVG